MIYYATVGKEVKKMMNRDQFLNQVDAAIEIGDSKLIRKLIIIARKNSWIDSEQKLMNFQKMKGLSQPLEIERLKSLDPERVDRIKSRYYKGEPIKSLAISFGIKASLLRVLAAKWIIEDKNLPITNDMDEEKFQEANKKQINLRLNEENLKKLVEVYNYWKTKGNFKFLDNDNTDPKVFNSEVSFSKFILETSLNNLYIDMENEKQIDYLAEWVAEIRIKNKDIKSSWDKLKDSKVETWNLKIKELNQYIESINELEKKNLFKRATEELSQVNEDFFEIIWPIALNRSHFIPDKQNDHSSTNLKISRLKSIYGNN